MEEEARKEEEEKRRKEADLERKMKEEEARIEAMIKGEEKAKRGSSDGEESDPPLSPKEDSLTLYVPPENIHILLAKPEAELTPEEKKTIQVHEYNRRKSLASEKRKANSEGALAVHEIHKPLNKHASQGSQSPGANKDNVRKLLKSSKAVGLGFDFDDSPMDLEPTVRLLPPSLLPLPSLPPLLLFLLLPFKKLT